MEEVTNNTNVLKQVNLSMTVDELNRITKRRGKQAMAAYVKELILKDLESVVVSD